MGMEYRRVGSAGIKTSVFSYGSWLTFGSQQERDASLECMSAAYEAGVNFFDNAEVYAGGQAETVMGEALEEFGWARHSYLVSTKYFWGIHRDVPNAFFTLNRKYLMEAIDKSLERLRMDHIDLVYCHRPDPETPIEETVWAMSDIVASGRALYWGTSEWSAQEIRAAWEIAERHHLRKPIVEQPEYNLFKRERVEVEYARLYEDIGLGLTTFSPLASGLLTGKYQDGIPDGSRGDDVEWLRDHLTDESRLAKVDQFLAVAGAIGCTPGQLALAWTASNPNVSSVIIGARNVAQLSENLQALEVLKAMTPEQKTSLDELFA